MRGLLGTCLLHGGGRELISKCFVKHFEAGKGPSSSEQHHYKYYRFIYRQRRGRRSGIYVLPAQSPFSAVMFDLRSAGAGKPRAGGVCKYRPRYPSKRVRRGRAPREQTEKAGQTRPTADCSPGCLPPAQPDSQPEVTRRPRTPGAAAPRPERASGGQTTQQQGRPGKRTPRP